MPLSQPTRSKIHIARQQLGLADDTYRELLARVAGVRSSTQLTERKAEAVLREFQRLGWQPKASSKAKGKPCNFASSAMPLSITKIEAQLADMGLPWSYADRIAKQMFGVARVSWVRKPDQLKAIIAALHVEQERRELLTRVEGLMADLDKAYAGDQPVWRASVGDLPKGWQRHRPTLKRLVEQLGSQLEAYLAGDDIPW